MHIGNHLRDNAIGEKCQSIVILRKRPAQGILFLPLYALHEEIRGPFLEEAQTMGPVILDRIDR